MILKSASEREKIGMLEGNQLQVNDQNDFWNDQQNTDNLSNMFENRNFDIFNQQNSEFDMIDEFYLYGENFVQLFDNQKSRSIKSDKNLNCSSCILTSFNKGKEKSSKDDNSNIIEMKNNNSKSFQFQYFDVPYSPQSLNDNNLINYNYQIINYISQSKSDYDVQFQFGSNALNKKERKRRGTGDEAQKKHPNDNFNFENKPCYIFLVSIANSIYRSKCTFAIINKVANIIEQLNPKITKRARMEKRRKNVQLCWFHNNWSKIHKMKKAIIEQLTLAENQNQSFI